MPRGRKPVKKDRLPGEPLGNIQQERFCQYYVTQDVELYGNGTASYIKAYILDVLGDDDEKPKINYKSCQAAASRLLSKVIIYTRINELLETGGFNDSNVEKQHLFLINQHEDLKTKKGSVEMYYKLKGKLIDRQEHTVFNIANVLDEIEAEKNARLKTQGQNIQTRNIVQDQE